MKIPRGAATVKRGLATGKPGAKSGRSPKCAFETRRVTAVLGLSVTALLFCVGVAQGAWRGKSEEKGQFMKRLVALCASAVALTLALACAGCAKEGPAPSGPDAGARGDVSVTMVIESATDTVAFDAKTATVQVPATATVYDALVATGWTVDAEDGEWGKYVHAIDGHTDGASWGWTYTENGEMVMDGASAHVVVPDATYTWTLMSW